MFQFSAYDHVRLEMEEVRRRAERLGRHRPPTSRRSTRTRGAAIPSVLLAAGTVYVTIVSAGLLVG